jgi:tetratricopeptide (TPR) repeat protein
MKRLPLVFMACLGVAFASCGGRASIKSTPRHLTAGPQETEKGIAWYTKGCYRKALTHFFHAYESFSMSDRVDGVAMSLNNLGTIHRALGNWEDAIAAFEEAHHLYKDLHDLKGAWKALSNQAAAFIQMGDLKKGEETLERALALSDAAPQNGPPISLWQNRAVLLTKQGRFQEAEAIFTDCLNHTQGLSLLETASLHFAFGNMMFESNRPAKAVASFEKALALDKQVGFFRGIADDLSHLAQAYRQLGNKEQAVASWKRAVKILALLDRGDEVDNAMEHLRESAREAKIDISVTEGFVERWRQGRLYESPCEE